MANQERPQVLGGCAHAVGADLDQAEALEDCSGLRKRILGDAEEREQFLEGQAEAAGGDLKLLVQRRVSGLTGGTGVGGAGVADASEQSDDGGRSHAAEAGLLATRTGDAGCGRWLCQCEQASEECRAEVVELVDNLFFLLLQGACLRERPSAQAAGDCSHALGQGLHKRLQCGRSCGTIHHALLQLVWLCLIALPYHNWWEGL
jgi:hypothetical protein